MHQGQKYSLDLALKKCSEFQDFLLASMA